MSALPRSDRLNPVFLKELRQSLRGRMFAILFPATVCVAVVVAITVLVDGGRREDLGPAVFEPIFVVLSVALLGLVPFSAFQSTAGEWDEATHDLLVLSNLRPTRIVLGKLLTSALEGGLYVAAFLPLLLFTFLLSGVDVRDVLFLVAALYAASLAMSALAMAFAGLSRHRFWRVILLAALAGVGLLAMLAAHEFAEQFVARGRGIFTSSSGDEVAVVVVTIVVIGTLAFAFAATRIAHPEDDRSGPVRIAATALLVAGLLWLRLDPFGVVTGLAVTRFAIVFGVLTAVFAIGFVTEPERLPRRTATLVPANPVLALLATPFLPGGGRGVLWWLLQLAIVCAWAMTTPVVASPYTGAWALYHQWSFEAFVRWSSMMAYFVVYLAGISLVTTRLRQRSYGPLAVRIALPAIAVLSMVIPILLGFLAEDRAWQQGEHPLLPFHVAFEDKEVAARGWALFAGAFVLLANVPRFARSFAEVLAASRARRAYAVRRTEVVVDVV